MTQYQPSVYFKRSFNEKMECDTRPTVTNISSKKGESLKDMVVRAKIQKVNTRFHTNMDVWPVTQAGIFSQRHRWWPRISFLWGNQDDYMKTTNLKNYRFFWFSTSWGITAPKNLYLHKFSVWLLRDGTFRAGG